MSSATDNNRKGSRDEAQKSMDDDRCCSRPPWRWRSPWLRRPAPRTARSRPRASCKIGWAQDPQTLNPFVGQDEEDFTVWAINWDLLVNFSPKDLSPVPGIAKSWDVSDDKKTVTFHLDPNAKWSDGKPITSADVKYSLEVLGGNGALFTSYTDNVTTIETPDARHGRDPHQAARRADRRRPVHLHPPQAHLGQGAGQAT